MTDNRAVSVRVVSPGALAIVFATALAAIALVVAVVARGPAELAFPDAMEYADTARCIARGEGALDRAVWTLHLERLGGTPAPAVRRATLFPLFESLAFRLFGSTDRVAVASSGVWFGATLALTFALSVALAPAPRFATRSAVVAAAATAIVALDPLSLAYGFSGLSEPMFSAAVLGVAALATAPPARGKWFAVGLAAGASQAIRLNGFWLVGAAAVAAWIFEGARSSDESLVAESRRRRARAIAGILAGAALPLCAIALRNARVAGTFSFVGPNGAILFNEVGGFSEHGIERAMFPGGANGPGLGWLFAEGRFAEFAAKAWRGLERNLTAGLGAAGPFLWGAAAFGALRTGASPATRATTAFAATAGACWIATFAVGEFEGPRFVAPLTPLLAALAARALDDARGPTLRAVPLVALVVAQIFPGVARLASMFGEARRDPTREGIRTILAATPPDAAILTDIPWATAWYGDRASAWIPRTVGEVGRASAAAGADRVLLSAAAASNPEIEPRWRAIYLEGRDAPPDWTLEASIPNAGLRLFRIGPGERD